jgi:hypothetical protein
MGCGGDAHGACAYTPRLVVGAHISPSLYILSLTYSLCSLLDISVWVLELPSVYAVHRLVDGRWEVVAADADRDQHRRPWCRVAVVSERRPECKSIERRRLIRRYARLHRHRQAGRPALAPAADKLGQRVYLLDDRIRTKIWHRTLMSAYGPKRTSLAAPHMSASGGRADMGWCTANVCF